jgi:hypothetical protein
VRTVIYSMGVSLDCYIAGPNGNDWGPGCRAAPLPQPADSERGLHLLGRRLYEAMALWDTAEERTAPDQRNDLKASRTSVEKRSGSSQAAKWPPLSTSLK